MGRKNIPKGIAITIILWLALSMRVDEITEITAKALERAPGQKPRIVRDEGSRFVAAEWREVLCYFEG